MEEIVASLHPRPDAPAIVRKLPAAIVPARNLLRLSQCLLQSPRRRLLPHLHRQSELSWNHWLPHATNSRSQLTARHTEKLRRVQDLMRHSLPSGDLATILDRALGVLLLSSSGRRSGYQRERVCAGREHRDHVTSRRLSAVPSGSVMADGVRSAECMGGAQRRDCSEFHHVRPFASGGEPTEDNVELRCRAHDQYGADLFFLIPFVARECGAAYTVN